ncbi:hypothetical protein U0C82_08525 [Fulvimarina sp. 2208YS6-2-32]|uniref:Uncharacterized protein n=1 Tax=Fulvimarina uroteuthidis TaxID=3098149 RepID=A0ABU5I1D1_9HYPH|nr:hypothetical protein [Fulvimarina sp. 2208YS6-2-32]MDY8109187.1 hypothetical protein [Fulvimarina sp. 2208YS6-2-32]
MAETSEKVASLSGTRRLADAVRAAKIAAAQRSDVVVDIREADRARLEILAEELKPIAEEVGDDDLFDFVLTGGQTSRYWIDGTAHVTMARDRRTYRFVRETRLGRVTLAESTEPRKIADHVTTYVAERVVERDRAYAVDDGIGQRASNPSRFGTQPERGVEPMTANDQNGSAGEAPDRGGSRLVVGLVWFLLGIVVGAGIPLILSYLYLA